LACNRCRALGDEYLELQYLQLQLHSIASTTCTGIRNGTVVPLTAVRNTVNIGYQSGNPPLFYLRVFILGTIFER
jgi:hypothetical protein